MHYPYGEVDAALVSAVVLRCICFYTHSTCESASILLSWLLPKSSNSFALDALNPLSLLVASSAHCFPQVTAKKRRGIIQPCYYALDTCNARSTSMADLLIVACCIYTCQPHPTGVTSSSRQSSPVHSHTTTFEKLFIYLLVLIVLCPQHSLTT